MDPNQQTPPEPQQPAQPVSPPPPQNPQPLASPTEPASAQPSITPVAVQPQTNPETQPQVAAFMNPASSASTPSPKKPKKRLVIVLALIVVAGAAAAAFVLNNSKTTDEPISPQTSQQGADQPLPSSAELYPMSENIKVDSAPTFNLPSALDDWQQSTATDGNQLLTHVGGCKVVLSESKARATSERTDLEATDKVIADDIAAMEKSATVEDISYGQAAMAVKDQSKKLEMKTSQYTQTTLYTSLKVIVTVRTMDGFTTGTRFYCPESAFSQNLNNELLEKLSINMELEQ